MHPVIFTIKEFKIYSYGAMLVLGFLAGMLLALKRAGKNKITSDTILDVCLWLLIMGIISARLVWVIINIGDFLDNPWQIINLRSGGLSWHGALLGGFIAVIWFAKKNKLSFGKLIDTLTPSFILGLAIGRIGCFLNGCCYGKGAIGFIEKFIAHYPFNGRYPAQLFEFILGLFIFVILLLWEKKTKFAGELYLTFLLLYSIVRFTVDIYRYDPFSIGHLALGQFISLIIMTASLGLIIFYRRKFS